MTDVSAMREEIKTKPEGVFFPEYFRCKGYEKGKRTSKAGRRADGIEALFTLTEPYIYKNDHGRGAREGR